MSDLKLYPSKRTGALGALMDLYEVEVALFYQTIREKVSEEQWSAVVDAETKDPDCRSIQTICQHMVGAGIYYVELVNKAENAEHKIEVKELPILTKADFEPRMEAMMDLQRAQFEGRWDLSDEEIEKIVVKTGWGTTIEPESLLEHAVLHVMRHHRQILRWLENWKA